MRLYSIIKKPVVTEKTSRIEMLNLTYTVEVDSSSTKIDIKKAFSEVY
jgi:ribosomal protein L23